MRYSPSARHTLEAIVLAIILRGEVVEVATTAGVRKLLTRASVGIEEVSTV